MSKQTIYICPNSQKKKLLESFNYDNKIHNIKFFNKQEFINNYYFTYDDKTIYYLFWQYMLNII